MKTNNPDPYTIELTINGESALLNISIFGKTRYYDDVDYLCRTDTDSLLQKVKGGYIGVIKVKEQGDYTVEVRELSPDGYIAGKAVPLTVLDYESAENAAFRKIISENTDSSMNPLEKMRAVEESLKDGTYRYLTNNNSNLTHLASLPNMPWFVVKRWDSAVSPAALQLIGEMIGGFTNIHGGYDWNSHAYAFMTYEGTEYCFFVCPSVSTGETDFQMIDFDDPGQLYQFR